MDAFEVVGLGETDIPSCAAVLGQAFHEDPLQVYMLPDPTTRHTVAPRQFIGVLPAWQGHGIGSALMRPALAQADVQRLPCFVETVQPRDRPWYERHGFRLVGDHVDAESGLRLLSFLRPPQ